MPSSDVRNGWSLTRLRSLFPGQFGINGTDTETGLRNHCTGAVFYVDPNAAGVSDLRDGTDPEAPLRTIAAALTHCEAHRGDLILVMDNDDWQFASGLSYALPVNESVIVTVPGVTIRGVAPSGSTGVVWRPPLTGGTCCTVQALDVLVEGFCFMQSEAVGGGGRAIFAEWNAPLAYGDNLSVQHCFFDHDLDVGVQMDWVFNATIRENVFQGCDLGIYVDPADSDIADCIIENNYFHNCMTGAISLAAADGCYIHGNRIYNADAQAGVAATGEGITTTGGSENLVTANYLSCLLGVGAGQYGDLCDGAATDAWCSNFCQNGPTITTP